MLNRLVAEERFRAPVMKVQNCDPLFSRPQIKLQRVLILDVVGPHTRRRE